MRRPINISSKRRLGEKLRRRKGRDLRERGPNKRGKTRNLEEKWRKVLEGAKRGSLGKLGRRSGMLIFGNGKILAREAQQRLPLHQSPGPWKVGEGGMLS